MERHMCYELPNGNQVRLGTVEDTTEDDAVEADSQQYHVQRVQNLRLVASLDKEFVGVVVEDFVDVIQPQEQIALHHHGDKGDVLVVLCEPHTVVANLHTREQMIRWYHWLLVPRVLWGSEVEENALDHLEEGHGQVVQPLLPCVRVHLQRTLVLCVKLVFHRPLEP
eukprot:CAMPEP_0177696988 /NCGR_PEP_ID=MMETSP0484_2-20121128/4272_1 /TAXON_ID=354590 /ORGANISM="Rhodomonas lens, Strain RHODO" /LENGTH=166 /DNA_ID=CAMNT_0019207993 /DNA_START=145 /DNA_END=645 /DNA_ORIENTATION=+